MLCPYCNQNHPDGYQFCPTIGKKIEQHFKACTNIKCGCYGEFVLPLEAKFCPQCGCSINPILSDETPNNNNDVLTFEIDGISFNMIKIEKGTFVMGATEEQVFAKENEKPVHKVTITNDYYMGEYLVTQELWKVIMKYP